MDILGFQIAYSKVAYQLYLSLAKSFASRVSYSLLSSANLQKLATYNEKDYAEMIEYYCTNRKDLKNIREYLIKFKKSNLNRMIKFTKDFEKILTSVHLDYKS